MSERRNWFGLTAAATLAAAAAWIYAPVFRGDWIWDDTAELVSNTLVRDPAGLGKIWFAPDSPDYFPLKTTVEWLEWRLWGANPLGYHLVNIGLHALSAGLLGWLLRRLGVGRRGAGAGAMIFLVHPLAVESVAWISELKNVLALPCLLLAGILWLRFEGRARSRACGSAPGMLAASTPGVCPAGPAVPPYLFSLVCFTASLLCKTSGVMFPLILLAHAWWRRGRIGRRDLVATLPFFAVSLGLGLVTVWFQQHRAIAGMPLVLGGTGSRLAVAGMALVFYFGKCLWPTALIPNYPRWVVEPVTVTQFLPWVAVGGVLVWLWAGFRTGRGRWLIGALAFGLCLVPVLGLIPMAYMRISWVADHLGYLALAVFAGGVGGVVGMQPARRAGLQPEVVGFILIAGLLAWQSRQYTRVFRDEEALWTYTLGRNPASWTAENDWGMVLFRRGMRAEAAPHFQRALELNPDDAEAHFNLGLILAGAGRWREAGAENEAALRVRPRFSEAHNGLGQSLLQRDRVAEAMAQFQEALAVRPAYPDARTNLGVALARAGRLPEAIAEFEAALRLRPGDAETAYDLGLALANAGRTPEAITRYEQALRARPDYAEAHNNLGVALIRSDRPAEAAAHFEAALRLEPTNRRARENLEAARAARN